MVAPQDSVYKTEVHLFDETKNIVPKPQCCFGCCKDIQEENKFWCTTCGFPICQKNCSMHLEACKEFSGIQAQHGQELIGADFLYFDLAVSKVFQKLDEFESCFMDLCQHIRTTNYMATSPEFAEWKNRMNEQNMPLSYKFAPPSLTSEERTQLIQIIFAVICVFGIRSKENKHACYIFPGLHEYDHSCASNTEVIIDEDTCELKVYASKYIEENEFITIDLINEPLLPTHARQALLLSQYGFKCECKRCRDPTEHGTYFSNYSMCECSDVESVHPIGYLVSAELEDPNLLWCTNREKYGCKIEKSNAKYVDSEKSVVNVIKCTQGYEPQKLYNVLKKLYTGRTKDGTFHENFHLIQYLRTCMLKLIDNRDIELEPRLPCRYVKQGTDQIPSISPVEAKFLMDLYDQTAYMLKKFLQACSRKLAYTMYEKAKKGVEFIECLTFTGARDQSDVLMHTVQKFIPERIIFWCIMNMYANQVDAIPNAINTKFLEYISHNPTKYIDELKEIFKAELVLLKRKILNSNETDLEEDVDDIVTPVVTPEAKENSGSSTSSKDSLPKRERKNILMEALLEREREWKIRGPPPPKTKRKSNQKVQTARELPNQVSEPQPFPERPRASSLPEPQRPSSAPEPVTNAPEPATNVPEPAANVPELVTNVPQELEPIRPQSNMNVSTVRPRENDHGQGPPVQPAPGQSLGQLHPNPQARYPMPMQGAYAYPMPVGFFPNQMPVVIGPAPVVYGPHPQFMPMPGHFAYVPLHPAQPIGMMHPGHQMPMANNQQIGPAQQHHPNLRQQPWPLPNNGFYQSGFYQRNGNGNRNRR